MTPEIAEFRGWIPTEHWQSVVACIADSIETAHHNGPDRWGLRLDGSLMLKVGPHEVLQIGHWARPCHIVVDHELVPRELRTNHNIWFSGDHDWQGNAGKLGYYASNPGTEACRFDFPDLAEVYASLAPAHRAVVQRAAHLRRHASTIRAHAADLVMFIGSEVGRQLQQPSYYASVLPADTTPQSDSNRTSRERSAWWFGVNNSRARRSDSSGGHVHYPDIAGFIHGAERSFSWPYGGAPGAQRMYARMHVGDDVVFWMGDGVEREWGIIGFATIEEIQEAAQLVILAQSGGPIARITPYPAGQPSRTDETAYLRQLFGPDFRPLRKMYVRLGYDDVKPYVITIESITIPQHHSLRERTSGDLATTFPPERETRPDDNGDQDPRGLQSDDKVTGPPYQWSVTLSPEEYVAGLRAIEPRMSDLQKRLLVSQYHATDRTVFATELARMVNVAGGHPIVNSLYGRLGHLFADATGHQPDRRRNGDPRWWSVWSRGYPTRKGFIWQLLPAVAEALDQLGWVAHTDFVMPDELPDTESMIEGALKRVTVNAYERNTAARNRCIEHYGATCSICGFDFGATYGDAAAGYIHVHHLKRISEIASEYVVDPIVDLRPVCPNCHAVVHRKDPPYTFDEMRALLRLP